MKLMLVAGMLVSLNSYSQFWFFPKFENFSKSRKCREKDGNKKPKPTPVQSHAYYAGLVDDVNSDSKESVKETLHKIMNSAHIVVKGKADQLVSACTEDTQENCKELKGLSYKSARQKLFGGIHLKGEAGSYSVYDVYCLHDYTEADYKDYPGKAILGPNVAPWHEVFNAEHVWPQSRFLYNAETDTYSKSTGDDAFIKKGDMHILYPSNHLLNGMRSNYEFGDVVTTSEKVSNMTKNKIEKICNNGNFSQEKCDFERSCFEKVRVGFSKDDNQTVRFEPPAESKGNVARSIFYFSVRHNLPIRDIEENTLREWNKLDPVDEMEKHRNEEIYKIQNVRNPFIDMPGLVDLIQDF